VNDELAGRRTDGIGPVQFAALGVRRRQACKKIRRETMFKILLASLVLLAAIATGCCPCHHDTITHNPDVALTK
jgi:hypothetical protein